MITIEERIEELRGYENMMKRAENIPGLYGMQIRQSLELMAEFLMADEERRDEIEQTLFEIFS